jgi:pimeloyl-ACP methyl ester carboxylesterase
MASSTKHLILLHGALGCAKDLQPLKERLQDRYILHVFDFPGHGDFSGSDTEFGIPAFAHSLDQYCKDLGQAPMVFGYSMGGYVALYAEAYLKTPMKGIITLGTKYAWDAPTAEKETSLLEADRILTQFPEWARQLQKAHGKHWNVVLEKTAMMIRSLGNGPLLGQKQLETITIPVRVLRGEKDRMVSAEESLMMAEAIPNGHFIELPGQPHPLDRVDLELLIPFFDQGLAEAGSSA